MAEGPAGPRRSENERPSPRSRGAAAGAATPCPVPRPSEAARRCPEALPDLPRRPRPGPSPPPLHNRPVPRLDPAGDHHHDSTPSTPRPRPTRPRPPRLDDEKKVPGDGDPAATGSEHRWWIAATDRPWDAGDRRYYGALRGRLGHLARPHRENLWRKRSSTGRRASRDRDAVGSSAALPRSQSPSPWCAGRGGPASSGA